MSTPARAALDDKLNQVFAGKCVRKDLMRAVKVGANVPVAATPSSTKSRCAWSATPLAECVNFGSNSLRIADDDVHAFERLLCLCGCPPQARR